MYFLNFYLRWLGAVRCKIGERLPRLYLKQSFRCQFMYQGRLGPAPTRLAGPGCLNILACGSFRPSDVRHVCLFGISIGSAGGPWQADRHTRTIGQRFGRIIHVCHSTLVKGTGHNLHKEHNLDHFGLLWSPNQHAVHAQWSTGTQRKQSGGATRQCLQRHHCHVNSSTRESLLLFSQQVLQA